MLYEATRAGKPGLVFTSGGIGFGFNISPRGGQCEIGLFLTVPYMHIWLLIAKAPGQVRYLI